MYHRTILQSMCLVLLIQITKIQPQLANLKLVIILLLIIIIILKFLTKKAHYCTQIMN